MKKFYTLLALLVCFAMQMSAKDYYTLEGLSAEEDFPAVDKIETGVDYIIGNPRSNGGYFSATGLTSQLTEACIFRFIEYGKDQEGYTTYILQNVSTGEYFSGEGFSTYTTSKSRAWIFTAEKAEVFAATEDADGAWQVDWEVEAANPRTATQDNDTHLNYVLNDLFADGSHSCFVFREADVNDDLYLCCYGGMAGYRDTNCWALYKPRKLTGTEAMEPVFNDIFGGVEFSADDYPIGSGPGQFGEEAVNKMSAAWETFYDLYNNLIEASNEDCDKAIADIEEAWKNLQESMGSLEDGKYYRFWNWRNDGTYKGCMYDDGTNVRWTENYTAPEELDVANTKYVWQLHEKDGRYYFQNYLTGRYMNDVSGFSQAFKTSSEAETGFIIEPNAYYSGAFNVRGDQYDSGRSMHTQVSGYSVVYWYAAKLNDSQASLWKVETMDDEVIASLEAALAQTRLNTELQELLQTVENTYDGAFSYTNYLEGATFTFNRTETSEPTSNVATNESYLTDGNPNTYYHSFWSQQGDLGQPHWFQVEMAEDAPTEFVVDITRRGVGGTLNKGGAVTRWAVVATNNEELAAADDYAAGDRDATLENYQNTWESYQIVECTFNKAVNYNGTSYADAQTEFELKFDQSYKYIRFLALVRMVDTVAEELDDDNNPTGGETITYGDLPSNNVYFCIGELSFRSADIDESTSLINGVPAEQREALEKAMLDAREALDAEAATKGIIKELQDAYDAFLEVYPEPQVVRDLIADAKLWSENAPISDSGEMGYFPEGSTDDLDLAIETVEGMVKDVMTMEEINECKKILNDAIDALNKQLVYPEPGLYYIKSTTSGAAKDNYVGILRSGKSQVDWGAAGEGLCKSYPNYLWKLEKVDGGFTLYNYGNGNYLGVEKESEEFVYPSNTPQVFKLRSSRVGGSFNFVFADNVFMNADPSGGIVTWGEASGADNSSFTFEEAEGEWDGSYTINYEAKVPQIVTLPYDVIANSETPLFKVLGYNNGMLHFATYDKSDEIPAGTPFLYYSEDEDNSIDWVDLTTDEPEEIVYTTTATNQGCMFGTLRHINEDELKVGTGIIWRGKITGSEQGDEVEANTGYFVVPEEYTGDSDLQISCDLNSVTQTVEGIATVITKSDRAQGIFDLQGRKVSNMSKGLYIINGKKFIIK